ncbi:hypothetical protein SKAU_G00258760 [Synaphobranchus kaupii]|uniref:Uncharacterized protein n=1 Tax=Synaphobranchus kaupii TaxID=118154 RepID=A0A9Q1F4E9_SYNKA|nr:hypothetical protein SKAU_G00258760 [Synaphobranchus kaupii]
MGEEPDRAHFTKMALAYHSWRSAPDPPGSARSGPSVIKLECPYALAPGLRGSFLSSVSLGSLSIPGFARISEQMHKASPVKFTGLTEACGKCGNPSCAGLRKGEELKGAAAEKGRRFGEAGELQRRCS